MARRLRLVARLMYVSVFAFGIMVWAVMAIRLGGITSTNVSDAAMIRRQNPLRLVSPDWVSPKGDLFAWLDAETHARMNFVFVTWALGMVWIVRRHVRRPSLKGEQAGPTNTDIYQ